MESIIEAVGLSELFGLVSCVALLKRCCSKPLDQL